MLALYRFFHISRSVYHHCNIDWWWVCLVVTIGRLHSSGKLQEIGLCPCWHCPLRRT